MIDCNGCLWVEVAVAWMMDWLQRSIPLSVRSGVVRCLEIDAGRYD